MAEVKKGDVVVGALGHRKALFGYSGHLPTELKPGDIVQLLNLGGVIGICDSIKPSHGDPINSKVLGSVLDFPYLGQRVGVASTTVSFAILAGSAIPVLQQLGLTVAVGSASCYLLALLGSSRFRPVAAAGATTG
jgi:hypothetical protein